MLLCSIRPTTAPEELEEKILFELGLVNIIVQIHRLRENSTFGISYFSGGLPVVEQKSGGLVNMAMTGKLQLEVELIMVLVVLNVHFKHPE